MNNTEKNIMTEFHTEIEPTLNYKIQKKNNARIHDINQERK